MARPSPPSAATWTAEDHGDVADEGFEARFLDWYERESAHRICWLAELSGQPVGMMNLALFERMPRPGRDSGTWGYLANAFVLAPHRDQGIGARLLDRAPRARRRPRLHPRRPSALRTRDPLLPAGRLHPRRRLPGPVRPPALARRYSSEAASPRIRATIRSASSSPIGTKSYHGSPRSAEYRSGENSHFEVARERPRRSFTFVILDAPEHRRRSSRLLDSSIDRVIGDLFSPSLLREVFDLGGSGGVSSRSFTRR